jgi:hypothetical protein
MTAMAGEDDALARSARLAPSAPHGAFRPESASSSSRSAGAGGSRVPLAGAAHSGLQAAAPELAGGPLVHKRCTATRTITRPPRVSLGSKGERDPPGAGMATQRSEGLD